MKFSVVVPFMKDCNKSIIPLLYDYIKDNLDLEFEIILSTSNRFKGVDINTICKYDNIILTHCKSKSYTDILFKGVLKCKYDYTIILDLTKINKDSFTYLRYLEEYFSKLKNHLFYFGDCGFMILKTSSLITSLKMCESSIKEQSIQELLNILDFLDYHIIVFNNNPIMEKSYDSLFPISNFSSKLLKKRETDKFKTLLREQVLL